MRPKRKLNSNGASSQPQATESRADDIPQIISLDQPLTPDEEVHRLEWYISHLDDHISDSKDKYLGSLSIGRRDYFDGYSTIVAPFNTEWTPPLKSRFFASLQRHSRLRPDLIASDIGMTVGQVIDYFELLQSGEKRVKRTNGGDEGVRDRRKRWKSGRTWTKGYAQGVCESNTDWINEEEELAEKVRKRVEEVEKEIWELEVDEKREEEVKRERLAIGLTRKDRTRSVKLSKAVENRLKREKEVAEWGQSITPRKLDILDKVIQNPPDQSSNLRDISDEDVVKLEFGRKRFGKHERMILDDKAIEYIEGIPTLERTEDHKKALNVLMNRRRVRQAKRARALSKRGMTEEQMEKDGGVDMIYLREAGLEDLAKDFDTDLTLSIGERWWAIQAGLSGSVNSEMEEKVSDKKRKASDACRADEGPSQRPGEHQTQADRDGMDVDATADVLKDSTYALGIGKLGLERGWDLFDFTAIGNMLRAMDGDTALTFDMLDQLKHELRAYLLPLIYQIITIAEQEISQRPPIDPEQSATTSNPAPEAGGITKLHVDTVLTLRNQVELKDDGVKHPSREAQQWYRDLDAPSNTPWHAMHIQQPPEDFELDGIDEWSDLESTTTDVEDEDLDEALDAADKEIDQFEYDRLLEERQVAIESGRPAKRQRKSYKSYIEDDMRYAHLPARREYEELLLTIMKRRRWRRSIRNRAFRTRGKRDWKRSRLNKESKKGGQRGKVARNGGWNLAPVIVDSDDEEMEFTSSEDESEEDGDDAVYNKDEQDDEDDEDTDEEERESEEG